MEVPTVLTAGVDRNNLLTGVRHMSWATELAQQHVPSTGEAHLYGVIIYTDRHVYVKKMLQDEAYWRALNDWSGPKWAVFAVRAIQGTYEMPTPRPGTLSLMVAVWKEPRENEELLSAFELDSTKDLPTLVVFVESADGRVRSTTVRIDDSSERTAYESLRETFSQIADALEFMYDENRRLEMRAFEVVSEQLRHLKNWRFVRNALHVFERLKSLLA